MNLWFRLMRVWLGSLRGSQLGPGDTSIIRVRIWPHDLDLWGHVNGGRYVTLSDLGRLDFFLRTGVLGVVRANHWRLPMGSVAVRFRRPLRLFQACELHTTVLGWDAKWGYFATDFVRNGEVVASLVMRGTTKDRDGKTVPLAEVRRAIGLSEVAMPVPDNLSEWFETDPTS